MDAIEIRIAQILGKDGRVSNRELARRIGVSEGTIRQRLGKLMKSGTLRVTAQAKVECVPDTFVALVGLKIEGRKLNDCARRIAALPAVQTTMIVTGRYDLVAMVLAPSRQTLVDFVADRLSAVPGIRDSETYVVLRSKGLWVDTDCLFGLHEPDEPETNTRVSTRRTEKEMG